MEKRIGAKPKMRNMIKNGAVNRNAHRPFKDRTAFGLFSFSLGRDGFHGEGG
jgi:hypothetical protein